MVNALLAAHRNRTLSAMRYRNMSRPFGQASGATCRRSARRFASKRSCRRTSRWKRRATATSPPRITNCLPKSARLRASIEARSLSAPAAEAAAGGSSRTEVRKLKIELDVIGDAIKQTRSEIVSLQDQGFDSSRVARVAKELEAVFGDTTNATDRILKAAEAHRRNRQCAGRAAQGRPRTGPRAGYPGSGDRDFRGVQFPRPYRPADLQGRGDPEDGRGPSRAHDGNLERDRPVQYRGRAVGGAWISTAC